MSRSLTSDREYQDHKYPISNAYYKMLVLLLAEKGYSETRYKILEPSCFPDDRTVTECRKAEWVKFYIAALNSGLSLNEVPDINSCDFLTNQIFEMTGTFATLETTLIGANNDLKFTSKFRGFDGNSTSISYVDPAANNASLSVTVVGNHIKVNLATGGGGAITSTASLVRAAINAHATASQFVLAELKTSNTGVGIVTVFSLTHLSGGTN